MNAASRSHSVLALLFLVGPVLLLDLGQAGGHDAAAVHEGHGHVLVGHSLDEVRLVHLLLVSLRKEQLPDSLLRASALQLAWRDLRLVLVRVDRCVRSQHWDREHQLVYVAASLVKRRQEGTYLRAWACP